MIEEHAVDHARLAEERCIEQHRVEMADKVEDYGRAVPRVQLDERVNQHQGRHVGAHQPGPARHGVVVEEQDQQPDQRRVGLGRIINKGVVLHSQRCCRYQTRLSAIPCLSVVAQE